MHYTVYFINLFIYGKYSVKPDRKNNSTKATNPGQKYLTNRLFILNVNKNNLNSQSRIYQIIPNNLKQR